MEYQHEEPSGFSLVQRDRVTDLERGAGSDTPNGTLRRAAILCGPFRTDPECACSADRRRAGPGATTQAPGADRAILPSPPSSPFVLPSSPPPFVLPPPPSSPQRLLRRRCRRCARARLRPRLLVSTALPHHPVGRTRRAQRPGLRLRR